MQSNGTRVAAVLGALALIVVLFFALGGDDGDDQSPTTTPTTAAGEPTAPENPDEPDKPDKPKQEPIPVVEFKDGEPVGGVADLEFENGDQVRFAVESDTADEIHIHGFDIYGDVEPGNEAEFDFPADIDGIFEVEMHGTATQIAELTVNP